MANETTRSVVVAGGGLAGLAVGTLLARRGKKVALFERSERLGGRASSVEKGGHVLNWGPHALYRGGCAARVLRALGAFPAGGVPRVSGAYAFARGRLHTFPGGFLSLLTTGLFGPAEKLEAARILSRISRQGSACREGKSIGEWAEEHVRHPRVRSFVFALVRLATYASDPKQSADAALGQLRLALRENVLYVDGGWQAIVDRLRELALVSGVELRTGMAVRSVERAGASFRVRLGDGSSLSADAVVLAMARREAFRVFPPATAGTEEVPEVRAACLDLALSTLPRPGATFALGIDRPLYFSVHSAFARLAPDGGATIHVARYLSSEERPEAQSIRSELESFADLVQPGWRRAAVERRFLPSMTVSGWLPTPATGSLGGRPGVRVDGVPGLYRCGDWVGPEGLLSDAVFASAEAVAREISGEAPTP
ncbi:MAG: dehydrogenase [Candidatus Binatia bacterium]|nr:MAG: dehydrogenase [Candidatus Binatia bacterium]